MKSLIEAARLNRMLAEEITERHAILLEDRAGAEIRIEDLQKAATSFCVSLDGTFQTMDQRISDMAVKLKDQLATEVRGHQNNMVDMTDRLIAWERARIEGLNKQIAELREADMTVVNEAAEAARGEP